MRKVWQGTDGNGNDAPVAGTAADGKALEEQEGGRRGGPTGGQAGRQTLAGQGAVAGYGSLAEACPGPLLPAALPRACAAPTPAASWMKAGLRLRMSRKEEEP